MTTTQSGSAIAGAKPARVPRIAIIGAGMSGLCLAALLTRAGIDTFVVYEKADRIGGTWRENTYPGVACDVPSLRYQFSFAPHRGWSHLMSSGAEVLNYFRGVHDSYRLGDRVRTGVEVTRCEFTEGCWLLYSGAEVVGRADFVVAATGVLHHPRWPDLPGAAEFAGPMFHSARWRHDLDLTGKRIGVIGTGSTAAQIVTALAPHARTLTLFQRTPQWVLPLPNLSLRWLRLTRRRRVETVIDTAMGWMLGMFTAAVTRPGWQRAVVSGWARANLATVRDRRLRAALTPDFAPLCRRLIVSSGYYRALQRANVALVTEGIDRVVSNGVRGEDGVVHECEVLVLATGFDAQAFVRPMQVVGRDGVSLDQAWAGGPRAYRTVAHPGFPNFFMVMGPHSPVGNFSLTAIAETQSNYILAWIQRWQDGHIDLIEPTVQATERFNVEVRAAAADTIWASGCGGWYLGSDGLPAIWPWHPDRHAMMLSELEPDEFEQARGTIRDGADPIAR
ncbi:MAG: NAD(P)/FAD-dependent oxidoreductase [Rhodococcus sp. (in: high G+C Gram-positive bacteria)]|uniref:flavin-containing monooxygenase n=1 Tax=Rhodococcus sp. TaxID=1831 RepID=UPI002AD67197|nr:NAD(P)/FAD-dependent oxidoreductase [Rhodococcus sp. (in: high G+C Gram-positive bacteria)]